MKAIVEKYLFKKDQQQTSTARNSSTRIIPFIKDSAKEIDENITKYVGIIEKMKQNYESLNENY